MNPENVVSLTSSSRPQPTGQIRIMKCWIAALLLAITFTANWPAMAADKKYVFAVVSSDTSNPFFEQVRDGCKKAEKAMNGEAECLYLGPKDYDASGKEEARIVNDLVARKVDGIAISPANPQALVPALIAAQQAGIPVLTWDSDLPDRDKPLRVAYIGTHNYEIGMRLGRQVKAMKPKGGTICIQSGGADAENHNERILGLRDTLAGSATNYVATQRLSGQNGWTEVDGCPLYTEDEPDIAVQQLQHVLQQNPRLDAFVGTGGFAEFLPQAYRDAVVKYKSAIENGALVLVFTDALPMQLDLLRQGLSSAQIGQRPYEMGYQAMVFLKGIKDGKDKPRDPTYIELDICTRQNVATCIGGG
jgi:ribose transport system substrate-binding protein